MTLVNKQNILPAPLKRMHPPPLLSLPTPLHVLHSYGRDGEIRKGGGRRIPPLLPFADNHRAVSAF